MNEYQNHLGMYELYCKSCGKFYRLQKPYFNFRCNCSKVLIQHWDLTGEVCFVDLSQIISEKTKKLI